MKKLIVIALLLFIGSVFAQDSKVPAEIKAKFQALYPDADEVKWDVEENNFEVSFESEDDVDMSLLFDASGSIIEIETEIEGEDLPEAVNSSIKKDFSEWDIEETAKIVRDGKTTYEAELEKGEKKMDAIFAPDGKLVKKIEKAEKDEDGEKRESGEENEKD